MTRIDPVRFGLIGAGRIGTHHATTLARRLGEAELVAVADPQAAAAERLGESLGVEWLTDAAGTHRRPAGRGRRHHVREHRPRRPRRRGGRGRQGRLRREADGDDPRRRRPRHRRVRELPAYPCRSASTGASPATSPRPTRPVAAGGIGTPQLLRSLTRDPGLADPAGGAAVDDLHPDAHPRLRRPQLVQRRRDGRRGLRHGRRPRRPRLQGRRACSTPPSSPSATTTAPSPSPRRASRRPTATTCAARSSASAGMVTAGSPAHLSTAHWSAAGVASPTARADTDLFTDAYAAELAAFCAAVRDGEPDAGRRRGRPRRAADRARLHRGRRDRGHGRPCATPTATSPPTRAGA